MPGHFRTVLAPAALCGHGLKSTCPRSGNHDALETAIDHTATHVVYKIVYEFPSYGGSTRLYTRRENVYTRYPLGLGNATEESQGQEGGAE
jgi:hypothetical protein